MTPVRTAVFLDRDGVLIENRHDYVKTWRDVAFLPGALDAVARLTQAGMTVVIVTNQAVVGRGLLSAEAAQEIQDRLIAEIAAHGGRIHASYLCPHHPDDGCDCRKPAPGMLRRAAREHGIDLDAAYMVGDALTDVEAGEAAGASAILVLTGRGRSQADRMPAERRAVVPIVPDLSSAVDYILARQTSPLTNPLLVNHPG